MQCCQRVKTGSRCTNPTAEHIEYNGYCKYHINRFLQKKDVPNPIALPDHLEDNIPAPTGAPAPRQRRNSVVVRDVPMNIPHLPMIGGIPIFQFNEEDLDLIINFNVGERLRNFVNINRDEIIGNMLGKTDQEQDLILFEIIVRQPQDEQNFLVANYERLIELINEQLNNQNIVVPPLQLPNNIRANQGVLINAILGALGVNVPQEPPPRRRDEGLASFVNDTENVHTKEVVNPVMDVAKKLIKYASKIPSTQDTFKEVIYECKLSDNARKQLAYMYYSNEKIYNLKEPTYRLVLDGLWYYVLTQKDDAKKDIILRLSQELEDNYGTCPAGNLSRLINVLSGFMEGVVVYEESIQDMMSKLSKIEDKNKRLKEAKNALKAKKIPEDQWDSWLEALSDA